MNTSMEEPPQRDANRPAVPAMQDKLAFIPSASARQDRGMIGAFIVWALGIVLLAGLVSIILHFADVRVFLDTLRGAEPLWLLGALACQVMTYVCAASVWQRALSRLGASIPMRNLLYLALIELFANQAVPTGGLSGSIMVVRGLTHRGVDPAVAITALLVAAASYYGAYLLVAFVAFTLLWYKGNLSQAWVSVSIVFVVTITFLGGAMLSLTRSHGRIIPAFARKWAPVVRFFEVLGQVRMDVLVDGRLLGEGVMLQTSMFLFDATTLWCAARSISLNIAPSDAFISFLFASVVATLSPVPMGLGTFEGTCTGICISSAAALKPASLQRYCCAV